MEIRWRYALVVLVAMSGYGCAGGFSQDLSRTQVSTEPAGATCSLKGKGFAQTIRTPETVILPKDAAPIEISCRSPEHRLFVASVKPVFNEKILGNVLVGSSLGIVVDMMNGHDTRYPERVHMNMEPTSFASIEARDAWFGRYRKHVVAKWDRAVRELEDSCNEASGEDGNCMLEVRATRERGSRALAVLEQQRRRAHVRGSDTAGQPVAAPEIQ